MIPRFPQKWVRKRRNSSRHFRQITISLLCILAGLAFCSALASEVPPIYTISYEQKCPPLDDEFITLLANADERIAD